MPARAVLLLFLSTHFTYAFAYPELFAALTSGACHALPKQAYGSHRRPQQDRDADFVITRGGKLQTRLTAGGRYNVTVKFPTPRRALLSSSSGTLVFPNKPRSKVQVWYGQPGIRNCPNRLAFGQQAGYAANKAFKFRLLLPKQGARSITLTAVSARSETSAFMVVRVTLQVEPGKAAGTTTNSSGSSSQSQKRQPTGA